MSRVVLTTILILLLPGQSFAKGPSSREWIEAPAYAPNIKMWLHESAAKKGQPISYFAVQKPKAEPKTKLLVAQLARESKPIPELLPHRCYRLQRKSITSRQTWCNSRNGEVFIFVESGTRHLNENDALTVELAALEGRP